MRHGHGLLTVLEDKGLHELQSEPERNVSERNGDIAEVDHLVGHVADVVVTVRSLPLSKRRKGVTTIPLNLH